MTRPGTATPSPEDVRIERLIAGGDGLVRQPGRPVTFVTGAAPGDLLRVQVERMSPQHRSARILEILEPGPGRRASPCPESDACGGCPWLHLSEAAQADAAFDILAAALRRAHVAIAPDALRPTRIPARVVHSRQRMRLHLDLRRTPVAGFLRAGSHDVHPAESCLALEPGLEEIRRAIVGALPGLRAALGPTRAEISVDLPRGDAGAALLRLPGRSSEAALRQAMRLLREAAPALRAVAAEAGGAPRVALDDGDDAVSFRRGPLEDPQGFPAFLAPGGFLQASREGSALLVSRVLAAAREAGLGQGARVLELHAGSGNFTLPLARAGCAVEASDSDARAVALAIRAARAMQPAPPHAPELVTSEAAGHARRALAEGRSFDAVLLDPPRTGAKDVAPLLARLAPVVIWVSCDAPTFARDAALAAREGLEIASVEPLLIFPQTAHFESVAVLRRRG